MNIEERARADWKRLSSDVKGAGSAIKVTTPDGATSVDVSGIVSKHHLKFDSEGTTVNAKNSHCEISEEILTDAGFVVRNSDEEVDMVKHRIEWADSSGITKKYVVDEAYADEKVGMIIFTLGDFED